MVKNKKKEIIIIASIILLLLVGVGGFFLLQGREKETTLTSEWDISWYDENEDEYTITTREQLYGFAELSQTIDFAEKTVKLGNDIVVNKGNAEDWNKKVPDYVWTPIANFAGTFDGQGHVLSGIFVDVASGEAGLFANTQKDSVIRDFQLLNTYVYSQTSKGTGAVASGGGGTFERIYTDAIIECKGFYCGGIMGTIRDEATFNECWFDGSIVIEGSCAGGIAAALTKEAAEMNHCLNTGSITSTYPGPDAAVLGGLCGAVSKTLVVRDSLNTGTVTSEEDLEQVGSLFGTCSGGTIRFDSVWTMKESASLALGYAKSGIDGIWGERTEKNLTGFLGYQKTDLDFDEYWAVVEEGTPILKCFAEKVPEIPEMERALVADVSWYNKDKKEYTLRTAEELLGLTRLTAKGYGNRFTDKTIKLGNDIVFNEGDAKDFAEEEPLNEWTPIYNYTGSFDGQGYTISGLYGSTLEGTTTGMALFSGTREMTVIQNLKITNSYFTTVTAHGLAAVSSRGTGTFKNIYADAILYSKDQGSIGGIMGMATKDGLTIENCWSDCDITSGGRRAGGILGNGNGKYEVIIKHCLNTGKITRSFKGLEADNKLRTQSALFGGIVGGTGTGSKGDYKGDFTIEDCLNVGVLSSEMEKDVLGGVIGGTTGLSSDKKVTVTVKNCYCSESSWTKAIGSKNSESSVYDCIRLSDEMLVGTEAYFYTSLNFKEYWAARSEKTPVLKTFAAGKGKTVAVSGERSDISWYTPGKTEYTITTAAQLYGLARLAYGSDKFEGVTIKLGADIVINEGNAADWASGSSAAGRAWTAIKNFAGTFDGQGYTISGLYGVATGVHEDRAGIGLFVETRDTAVIQNVSIKNSCFESTYANGVGAVSGRGGGTFKNIYVTNDVYLQNPLCGSVGAIIGIATKTATVENCWSAATITAAGQGVGGIIGNGNAQTVTIKHCLNTGTITRSFEGMAEALKLYDYAEYPSYYKDTTETAAYYGGIIGRTGSGSKGAYTGTFVIEDCLSVGTMTSERKDDALGGIAGQTTGNTKEGAATVSIMNSYCTESSATKVIASKNSETALNDCVRMPDTMLVGTDAYYYTGLDFDTYWAAIDKDTPVLKLFAGAGVVAVSGTRSDISWYSKGEAIMDAADLYGLVRLALSGETFKGETVKVGAKIELDKNRAWTPIYNFAGTFDGQGNTISGINGVATGYHADRDGMGLFVETKDTAVIQNLTIANSYFESTYANGVGAVAGRGGGTFKNIHVASDVKLVNKVCGSVGSIIGMATKETSVENCWSEASITAAGQRVGGIVGNGNSQTVTIKHCLNSGAITRSFADVEATLKLYDYAKYPSYYKDTSGSAGYYAGIIGGTGTGDTTKGYVGNFLIEDCVNIGVISSERENDGNGGIAGHTTGLTSDNKVTVTIANAYSAASSCSKVIGSKNSKTSVSKCTLLDDSKLTGVNAFYNTALDFVTSTNADGYWSVRQNATPMLTSFLSDSDVTIDVSGLSREEFVLVNNKGYIASLEHLISFRDKMNDGSLEVNSETVIMLTADIDMNEGWTAIAKVDNTTAPSLIWTPIVGFTGIFDGDGHTISGVYTKSISGITGIGLFTQTNNATIKNLRITNSHFRGNSGNGTGAVVGQGSGRFENIYVDAFLYDKDSKGKMGGIIGIAKGDVTVTNCWSDCDIESNAANAGGILGYHDPFGSNIVISHCLNTGNMTYAGTAANSMFGGIVGRVNSTASSGWKGSLTITDCMNTGIIIGNASSSHNYTGGIVSYASGMVSGVATTIINNCYTALHYDENGDVKGSDKVIGAYKANASGTNYAAVDYEDILGEVARTNAPALDYVSDTNADGYWTVREGKMPMLTTFVELSNSIDEEIARKTFKLVDNAGTISNLEQLISFRDQMNAGTISVDSNTVVILTADINMNEGWTAIDKVDSTTAPSLIWTPIVGFTGTFDGDGHTISGVYTKSLDGITGIGLFTQTKNATIKNLKITNSHFRGNSGNGTGAVVGQGSGTFENIYVDAFLYDKDSKGKMGGIIGIAKGDVTVTNCWSDCDIESNKENVGGILGYHEPFGSTIEISHCLNTGNLTYTGTGTNSMFGGIVGRTNSTSATSWKGSLTITDCLNTGIIIGNASNNHNYTGGILSYASGLANGVATTTLNNCYTALHYDENDAVKGTKQVIGAYKTNAAGENNVAVDYEDILGEATRTNAPALDYVSDTNADGYWTVREGKIPMLTVFIEWSGKVKAE